MIVPFITHSEITGTIYIVSGTSKYNVTEQVIKAMRETGRLEQQRPHGEWIDRSDGGRIRYAFWERYECSECGAKSEYTNYCPNCGAPMTEEAFRKYNGLEEGEAE